ncbi:hypothetical protein SARC_02358 [Sphaeroforma arctica JP610]|uniref:Uncharacterized protein n=1 Tax=Sphaeroforma arctica JP610 TaxID=667725 RepID=A0A0L0G8U4_9EUKA|nr:hypothetical protein SARC_02358 [Sphaeroforma arctica JP610]KNC85452.1 hypothetical protein SARC_02358 [Sphaeroforma arctica JP610]|eukprot:XP_014159354.1 hypothetical protein SARC_02358 [Sphaeroforma arctica JP610]
MISLSISASSHPCSTCSRTIICDHARYFVREWALSNFSRRKRHETEVALLAEVVADSVRKVNNGWVDTSATTVTNSEGLTDDAERYPDDVAPTKRVRPEQDVRSQTMILDDWKTYDSPWSTVNNFPDSVASTSIAQRMIRDALLSEPVESRHELTRSETGQT